MKSFNTAKVIVRPIEEGIINNIVMEGSEIDVEDLLELKKANLAAAGGLPFALLTESEPFTTATSEARKLSASKECHPITIARAIVVNSLSIRLIVNFYMKFNKPQTHTKIFSSREKALEWLRAVMKNHKEQNSRLSA